MKPAERVTGCMDVYAWNYDRKANVQAPCHYTSEYAGRYQVTDTFIQYHSDTLNSWYDTAISSFVITATPDKNNQLYFDTILCIYCDDHLIWQSGDTLSYKSVYSHYPINRFQDGRFVKDTLQYWLRLDPMSGGYRRTGKGIKLH